MPKILFFLFICCQAFKVNAQLADTTIHLKMTVDQYIEKYSSLAVDEMYRSKIPASITLAQGILESGNGNSRLAIAANNHFGIKCKATWTGKTVYEDDDAAQECFRKYDAAIDSYRDHSEFLMKNIRYAFLFDLGASDYNAWASGLKKAGYATNPQYAELLVTFIDRHNLHKFDGVKLSEEENRELNKEKAQVVQTYGKTFTNNGVPGIIAKANESYVQIANDYDIKVYQIYRNNDLSKDAVCKAGDTIYLKAKKGKSDSLYHLVKSKETMNWISQRYAIKLEKLLDRNLLREGQEPATGQKIYLNNKRENPPILVEPTTYTTELLITPGEIIKADTLYNEKVYEDPKQNLETTKPVELTAQANAKYDFKDNLSFFHTVQKGETLYSIGKHYRIRVDAIQFLNVLTGDSIGEGQRLIINPTIISADTKEPQTIPGIHKVRQGETLFRISKNYNLKTSDIKATNNLTSDTIKVGQLLVIVPVEPTLGEVKTPYQEMPETYYHILEKGENIYTIAKKYGITAKKIRELNNQISDRPQIGKNIRIR
ncbi:MAG: LysM peptidoglycan-binding domain-containing protein [Bacteroidia bacterium]|nr:LysM peptidoglycan-binding domain-containing protein [Bacteroidia bacterium]